MQDKDFPALYRSADELSLDSQKSFLFALKSHLVLLVLAAALSLVTFPHWGVALLQVGALLGALSCSIYLFTRRPDRYWYTARALAESIKTVTWRYVCCAEPFHGEHSIARVSFQKRLKAILDQNTDVARALTNHLDAPHITDAMVAMRNSSLEDRKQNYARNRIGNQLSWYAKKAAFNRRTSNIFFFALIAVNSAAVICAVLRIKFFDIPFWPTDILVAAAASLLSWMQAKRFSELAASYSLAANEIGLIREQSLVPNTEDSFSSFVGDAENAFSREHTQWVARKDE